MMRSWFLALLALLACCVLPHDVRAETTVRVVETWPQGSDVRLARNQNFHLRVAFETDRPVGIWLKAYHQGKPVNVGSNPSPQVSGSGEAMGWFFFMQPGDVVDEIRIVAGDGSRDNTPVVATWRGHIVAGSDADSTAPEPRWVVEMREQARLAQQRDYEARMAAPVERGDVVLFGGFMLLVLVLGTFGIVAPFWGVLRWRGGWRLAAIVPAALMTFVVLRIIAGTAIDPTSHNLWPFEVVMAGGISSAAMVALAIARRLSGAGRKG